MPFTCEYCGYEFSRRYNLHCHLASKHPQRNSVKRLGMESSGICKKLKMERPDMHQLSVDMQAFIDNASPAENSQTLLDRFLQENPRWTNVGYGEERTESDLDLLKSLFLEQLQKLKSIEAQQRKKNQIGRGLPRDVAGMEDIESDESMSTQNGDSEDGQKSDDETESTDDGESEDMSTDDEDSDSEDTGETEEDAEIKEAMGDIMYICCQRPEKRQEMLEKASKSQIKVICKCVKAILKDEIPINYDEKDKLVVHKDVLRKLADPEKPTKEKKKIIVQNGGNFLLSLVPTLIGALASMFQK